ncbi:hypothetical protein PR002_g26301 [Phytophthora rubi]|uniref:Uncharacterized protein n=1 Tax=Phytophthora rubi TaxID=129364 RepID=A0A6A3HRC4_9STRA|nr:hypothetical protein PR002_g26301 [Phytophthora rubi]
MVSASWLYAVEGVDAGAIVDLTSGIMVVGAGVDSCSVGTVVLTCVLDDHFRLQGAAAIHHPCVSSSSDITSAVLAASSSTSSRTRCVRFHSNSAVMIAAASVTSPTFSTLMIAATAAFASSPTSSNSWSITSWRGILVHAQLQLAGHVLQRLLRRRPPCPAALSASGAASNILVTTSIAASVPSSTASVITPTS